MYAILFAKPESHVKLKTAGCLVLSDSRQKIILTDQQRFYLKISKVYLFPLWVYLANGKQWLQQHNSIGF